MPNVKPGDLARVISDTPYARGFKGIQVFVHGPAEQAVWNLDPCDYPHWEVEALEHREVETAMRTIGPFVELQRYDMPAGSRFGCCDSHLRRIDPPADSLDIFKPEALPHEHKEPQSA